MTRVYTEKITDAFKAFLKYARKRSSLMYRPKTQIFSISKMFIGEPKPKYTVYLYNTLVAVCDTKKEAIQVRTQLYNA